MTENKLNLAGKALRVINVVVDMITFIIIWLVLSMGLLLLGLDQTFIDETGEQIPIVPFIILLPTFWGYYLFAEYKFQRTVGKLLTKTRVVAFTGEGPTVKQIIIRTLSRSIPFEYFSYLVTVEGIHDKLSKTRVTKFEKTSLY